MFGGAGDVGATALSTPAAGFSPEIPMSTQVENAGLPAQSGITDTTGGPSPSLWQQILNFTGLTGGSNASPSGQAVDPKTGQPTDKKAEIAALGKFLTSAQGLQSSLQNSKLAQQMIQQHINQPQQQGQYRPPTTYATMLLQQAGLL